MDGAPLGANALSSALLVRLGGLGDLLAVLPSIQLLRKSRPGWRLTLAGREDYGTLFVETGVVDELEPASGPRFTRLYSAGEIPADAASWLGGFAFVWGWMQARRPDGLEDALDRLGAPHRMLVYDAGANLPAGRYFFGETARSLGPDVSTVAEFDDFVFLPLKEAVLLGGRRLAESLGIGPEARYVVIHPGSGGVKKRWPLERFLETARLLRGDGLSGVFVMGEAETELQAELAGTNLPSSWSSISGLALKDLAGLLARSSLYLGNDSGVTHLAAACGAPTLAVFRNDSALVWKPAGKSRILAADEAQSVSFHEVAAAARKMLFDG